MSDAKVAAEELVAMAASASVKFPKIWGEAEIKRQCASKLTFPYSCCDATSIFVLFFSCYVPLARR